jgi:hypothetical protein
MTDLGFNSPPLLRPCLQGQIQIAYDLCLDRGFNMNSNVAFNLLSPFQVQDKFFLSSTGGRTDF